MKHERHEEASLHSLATLIVLNLKMLLVNIDSGPSQPGKIPLPVLVCDSSSVLGRTILAYQCVNNKILPSSLVGACCPSFHRGSDVGSNRSQISRWKPSRD